MILLVSEVQKALDLFRTLRFRRTRENDKTLLVTALVVCRKRGALGMAIPSENGSES
jgi:hypothetical protein